MKRDSQRIFFEIVRSNAFGLFLIVSISALLIIVNYFTIKTQTAVRAYIHGESQYSKGQKDASRNLIFYLETKDEFYWSTFEKDIRINIGDSLARVALNNNGPTDIIRKGLLQGRNHKDDIDNMVWLFINFKDVSFMKSSIQIWKEADALVGQLYSLGRHVNSKLKTGTLSEDEKREMAIQINTLTNALTIKEREFSDTLGDASRNISVYLFGANVLLILLIIGSASGYASFMIVRLKQKNRDLHITNNELDQFVYSASHDLRAPITSMDGLIEISLHEEDPEAVKKYLGLMRETLHKQDYFIREIIDFSKNKKKALSFSTINLSTLVDQVLAQHQYMPGATSITFEKQLNVVSVVTDPLRLEIILKNLVSNAIKYAFTCTNHESKKVIIRSEQSSHSVILQVEDNGVGIAKKYLEKIFELFFVTQSTNKGSGIGLYLTRETVTKLNGNIHVTSKEGKGTCFTIYLPLKYDN